MNLPEALRAPALRRLLAPGLRPVTEASGSRVLKDVFVGVSVASVAVPAGPTSPPGHAGLPRRFQRIADRVERLPGRCHPTGRGDGRRRGGTGRGRCTAAGGPLPKAALAVVILLMAPGGRGKALAYVVTWAAIVVVVTTAVGLAAGGTDPSEPGRSPAWVGWAQLLIGLLLLLIALRCCSRYWAASGSSSPW